MNSHVLCVPIYVDIGVIVNVIEIVSTIVIIDVFMIAQDNVQHSYSLIPLLIYLKEHIKLNQQLRDGLLIIVLNSDNHLLKQKSRLIVVEV